MSFKDVIILSLVISLTGDIFYFIFKEIPLNDLLGFATLNFCLFFCFFFNDENYFVGFR